MGDLGQNSTDQSNPPLPVPCPIPKPVPTARHPSRSSPPSATPKIGSSLVKTVICFVLSANTTHAAPSPDGLEQRINSSEPAQGLHRSIPPTLHWQKLNFCLITNSWCIDTHSGFLLSCLAVLIIAFLFELARWTSRWYDRSLVARLHHLKTPRKVSQPDHSRSTTSESEETIRPNRGFRGRTTQNQHTTANALNANGISPQDDVFITNGHDSSRPWSSVPPRVPPNMPDFSTPGRARFKALSAGRERVEGTGIILGRPDRAIFHTGSPPSTSTSSQSTTGPSRRKGSALSPIENRPIPPEPPIHNQQESSTGSRKKKRKEARNAGVHAPQNSPERAPLLASTTSSGGYTSLNDVAAAAAGHSMNGDSSTDDPSVETSNSPHHNNNNDSPPPQIPGIDEVGDPRILYRGLHRILTNLPNTFRNCIPSSSSSSSSSSSTLSERNTLPAWAAITRALLSTLQVTLALILGLVVVTTFNAWFLGCILLGLFAGKLVVGSDEVGWLVGVGVLVGEDHDDGRRGELGGAEGVEGLGGGEGVEGVGGGERVEGGKRVDGKKGGDGGDGRRVRMGKEDRRVFVPLLAARMGI